MKTYINFAFIIFLLFFALVILFLVDGFGTSNSIKNFCESKGYLYGETKIPAGYLLGKITTAKCKVPQNDGSLITKEFIYTKGE